MVPAADLGLMYTAWNRCLNSCSADARAVHRLLSILIDTAVRLYAAFQEHARREGALHAGGLVAYSDGSEDSSDNDDEGDTGTKPRIVSFF